MLRTYKPINHPIFTLHSHLEHLVCQVWCNASNNNSCSDLLDENFEEIYNAYDWLKEKVDAIYEKCKNLTDDQRALIREAFITNNRIEELCEGKLLPIPLNELPNVVKDDMKPLMIKFYDYLIDRVEVPGDKLDYYNKLLEKNPTFETCPCCGLSRIESPETHYREDNDHYLPKAKYPFASVNFQNLVPLCSKCNKKCKSTKNPFSSNRISFYAFDTKHIPIEVTVVIKDSDDLDYLKLRIKDITIDFGKANVNKISTWDWLFKIKERYNKETRSFSKTELRTIANRQLRNNKRKTGLTYEEILDDAIEDYEIEIFEDRKFLKVPFLKCMKTKPEWMAVYSFYT
ncbi:hypothetical protein [Aestuariibaculum sediminum]|uniref:HNH endonuclease n=1 Tax=Aestuariibaculum sediminum TaxID=2770637 RepID=A0A8J6Q6G7_9FLAO|nr:hypothetical protein [Aestuariibaculum sediminum]MBD0831828.1 hypothetical protein [Aestuariibaculum sediminum]